MKIDEKLLEFAKETNNSIIIVEGKNDKEALMAIGILAKDVVAINGRTLLKVVNEVAKKDKEVVILTDFDYKGKMLAAKLTRLLQAIKIHPNPRLRKMFIAFGRHQVQDIKYIKEASFRKKLAKEVDDYVKISTDFNEVHNKSKYKSKRSNRET
ncbi:MAG: toprim domain-containing protein [Nanoarchaeota archaeon]